MEEKDAIPKSILADIRAAEQDSPTVDLPPLPEGDIAASPSGGEIAENMAIGAARGATESATLLGSTVAGGRLGVLAAPFAGPLAPAMPFLGMAGGFGYGLFASDLAGKLFPEPSREDVESLYEGSRTTAGGLAFSPIAFTFRKAPEGANVIRKTISAIGDYARRNPKAYLASEGVLSFYAGVAGGAAIEAFPDTPIARPIAEVTAGFMPARLAFQLKDVAANLFAKMAPTGYTESTKNYVQNQLLEIARNAGEDPKEIAEAIRQGLATLPKSATGVPVKPTTAQLTGSPALTAAEKTLARNHAKFSSDTEKQSLEAMQAYKLIIRELEDTGDPGMLQAAASLREDFFAKQFQTAFNIAQTEAVAKAAKLGRRGSDTRADIGRDLQTNVEGFLRIARDTETDFWQKAVSSAYRRVPGTESLRPVQVKPSSFVESLYDVVAAPRGTAGRGVVERQLAPFTKDLKKLGVTKKLFKQFEELPVTQSYLDTGKLDPEVLSQIDMKDVSVMDLVRLRSGLLEEARKAAGTNDFAAASRYNRLASSVLEDLDKLDSPAYTEARQYSRALNDAFTRTFAGKITNVNRQGTDLYPPEVLVQRAFSAGADTTLQRVREIEAAADFVDPTGAAALSVRDAHRKVFRSLAAETLAEDGTIKAAAFDTFRNKNADALDYLGMQDEFKDISSAQRALLEVQDPGSLMNKRIREEKVFADLLQTDDPIVAVSAALTNNRTPVKAFKTLVDIAGDKGEEGLNGLKSTIYQYAYETANKGEKGFDVSAFSDLFFKPFSPNTPSLANMMRSTGLMTGEELATLKRTTNRMQNVEKTMRSKELLDGTQVTPPTTAIDQLVVSMLGAKFAGAISPGGPGSLSFAGRTIAMAQNIFNGMPSQQRLLLLQETMKDPELAAEMFSRAVTEEENRRLGLSILRRFYSPGVFPTAVDRYAETFTASEAPEQPNPRAAAMLRSLPPAPVTRGTPNVQLPTAQGPAEQAQAQQQPGVAPQAPGGESRQMLQQLFPFDATLQAAPQGQ